MLPDNVPRCTSASLFFYRDKSAAPGGLVWQPAHFKHGLAMSKTRDRESKKQVRLT